MNKGYMYILECSNGAYYTGSTKYLNLRLLQHQNGEGANFTRKHLPVKLVYFEEFDRIDKAFYREKQVQGWSRKKKEALIYGTNLLNGLAECRNDSNCKHHNNVSFGSDPPVSFDSAQDTGGSLSGVGGSMSGVGGSLSGVETTIRPYQPQDKEAVIQLFRLNTPEYFSPEEEKDLEYYLENEIEYYYVLINAKKVIGSGGFNFTGDESHARISWDLIHPQFQGMALGSRLLNYRLTLLKEFQLLQKIIVRTTQLVYPFYEKNGFRLVEIKKDFWAKGFDLYLMEYPSAPLRIHVS